MKSSKLGKQMKEYVETTVAYALNDEPTEHPSWNTRGAYDDGYILGLEDGREQGVAMEKSRQVRIAFLKFFLLQIAATVIAFFIIYLITLWH